MMINKVHAHLETPASLLIFPKAFGLFVLLGVCTCEDRLGRPSRRCGWNRPTACHQFNLILWRILTLGDHIEPLSDMCIWCHLHYCLCEMHQIYWPLHHFFLELHRTWCLHMYHVPSVTRWRWYSSSVSLGVAFKGNFELMIFLFPFGWDMELFPWEGAPFNYEYIYIYKIYI